MSIKTFLPILKIWILTGLIAPLIVLITASLLENDPLRFAEKAINYLFLVGIGLFCSLPSMFILLALKNYFVKNALLLGLIGCVLTFATFAIVGWDFVAQPEEMIFPAIYSLCLAGSIQIFNN